MNSFEREYFENGVESRISRYEDYRWMPQRSIREAIGFIDFAGIEDGDTILDYGCAKGFLVRAFRMLDINAEGCDISRYSLKYAPYGCWNCCDKQEWIKRREKYSHIIIKDVLEHSDKNEINELVRAISSLCSEKLCCVIPLGDNGEYRIEEYHDDITHKIAENEQWWTDTINWNGWKVYDVAYTVNGIKNHWLEKSPIGNLFILAEKK